MAKRTSNLLEYHTNASWLSALITIVGVCILSFIFIKIFHLKHSLTKAGATCENCTTLNLLLSFTIQSHTTPLLFNPDLAIPFSSIEQPTNKQIASKANIIKYNMPSTVSVITKRGDTMGKIFYRLGLSAKQLQEILKIHKGRALTRIKLNQTLVFTIKDGKLEKLIYPISIAEDLIINTDEHQHYTITLTRKKTTPKYQTVKATIKGSVYQTARRRDISMQLINKMCNIFSRDPDFKKGLNNGDKFSILYKTDYIKNVQVAKSEILAVSYTRKDITHEAIRYTNRNGTSSYYTPQGLSLKIGYDRYPLHFSHIASHFSTSRYHPILHYRRPHYGIDLAAPLGTPIHAIGDGRIEIIRHEHGYGNMIKIRHNDMYSTIYGHLARFEKGLRRGKMVKRGETIGYVGQTGLASGPHCHFEFHINKQPKNPITISLPHADPIPHREMSSFKQRVHQLLAALHHPKASIYKMLKRKDKEEK